MDDMEYGVETGRLFIYDDLKCECITYIPSHDEWHVWTEFKDRNGELWYSSDEPDGYWLDAEEFGPFSEADVITPEQLKEMWP